MYSALREVISVLRANGHPNCIHYPLAMAYSEHSRIVRRGNNDLAMQGIIIQAAAGSVVAGGDHFKKLIKDLTQNGGRY